MLLKYLLWWLPMILVAFANATIRELLFTRFLTAFRANQLSTLTLIAFCTIYTWLVAPGLQISTASQAIACGILWMLLTVAFEFFVGVTTHKSWQQMLDNYLLWQGHLWPLFLLALVMLPYIIWQWRK